MEEARGEEDGTESASKTERCSVVGSVTCCNSTSVRGDGAVFLSSPISSSGYLLAPALRSGLPKYFDDGRSVTVQPRSDMAGTRPEKVHVAAPAASAPTCLSLPLAGVQCGAAAGEARRCPKRARVRGTTGPCDTTMDGALLVVLPLLPCSLFAGPCPPALGVLVNTLHSGQPALGTRSCRRRFDIGLTLERDSTAVLNQRRCQMSLSIPI